MFDKNLFLRSINETLKCWPSFQLSLENGMGGTNIQEKLQWLSESILQIFRDNPDSLIVDDLVDFISEILNNEFDTIIEDGSLEMICQSLFVYHDKIAHDNHEFVLNELQNLKQKYLIGQEQRKQLTQQSNTTSLFSTNVSSTNDLKNNNQEDMQIDQQDNDNKNDGWTVVNRRKR